MICLRFREESENIGDKTTAHYINESYYRNRKEEGNIQFLQKRKISYEILNLPGEGIVAYPPTSTEKCTLNESRLHHAKIKRTERRNEELTDLSALSTWKAPRATLP